MCLPRAQEGCAFVEPRLSGVPQRTMLLVGGLDLALPSAVEGVRLAAVMQRAFVVVSCWLHKELSLTHT